MRDRDLKTAIQFWKSGEPLPLHIADRLMARGYDIPTLQRRYER